VGFRIRRNFFQRHILRINPYIHICPCSWALGICKNIGTRTYFGSMTADSESVRFFRHFAFCLKVPKLAKFFIAPKDCIFWGAPFEPIQNLATLGISKLQGFHRTPLYHCYTLQYVAVCVAVCVPLCVAVCVAVCVACKKESHERWTQMLWKVMKSTPWIIYVRLESLGH